MAAPSSLRNAALRARAMLEGNRNAPAWLEAFERFGVEKVTRGKSPKQLDFPEDRLYQAYLHKHPEFRQQPLDLNAENPSPMKLFVLTQAALMEKGHSRKAAYNIVEAEFNKALAGSSLSAGQAALTAAQKEEEAVLQSALRERREIFGTPANLDTEADGQPFSFRNPPRDVSQTTDQPYQQDAEPIGFQPGTSTAPSPTNVPNTLASQLQQGFRSDQQKLQAVSGGTQSTAQQQQTGHTAPAGFVEFGVEPKKPLG